MEYYFISCNIFCNNPLWKYEKKLFPRRLELTPNWSAGTDATIPPRDIDTNILVGDPISSLVKLFKDNQCLKTSTKLVLSPLRKLQSPNLIYIALGMSMVVVISKSVIDNRLFWVLCKLHQCFEFIAILKVKIWVLDSSFGDLVS